MVAHRLSSQAASQYRHACRISAPKLCPCSWARRSSSATIDVLYVAEVLGHSSPAITMSVYQHARPERTAEAVEKVGKAIFG